MNKVKLYAVPMEYLYGDDKEEKRQAQVNLLLSLGLVETDNKVICTAEQALALIAGGYCGSYVQPSSITVAAEIEAGPDVEGLFKIMADKLAATPAALPCASFNERCNQLQPGLPLTAIAETKLMENSCTDEIQSQLAEGWRILAIQPQPDQRRPDYILGRPLMSALRS